MATKKRSRFTEDLIPVQAINNGMIQLNSQEKVTGVKIQPRNIFILDYEQQSSVLNNLKTMYNQIDFEFWLVVADRPVDISVYLSQLQLLFNQEQNPAVRKLIAEDIKKGQSFMNNNVVDTEYFILFKERRPEIIQKRIQNMISGLASAGLQSSQVSNDDIRVLLDGFMNGGDTTTFGTVMSNI